MFFKAKNAVANAGCGGARSVPGGAEGLGFSVVAEDEVDAEGDGDGVYVEDLIDVGFEFLLLIVFLKGVDAGDDAVVVEDFSANTIVD